MCRAISKMEAVHSAFPIGRRRQELGAKSPRPVRLEPAASFSFRGVGGVRYSAGLMAQEAAVRTMFLAMLCEQMRPLPTAESHVIACAVAGAKKRDPAQLAPSTLVYRCLH